jgi:hypothetical protein
MVERVDHLLRRRTRSTSRLRQPRRPPHLRHPSSRPRPGRQLSRHPPHRHRPPHSLTHNSHCRQDLGAHPNSKPRPKRALSARKAPPFQPRFCQD